MEFLVPIFQTNGTGEKKNRTGMSLKLEIFTKVGTGPFFPGNFCWDTLFHLFSY